MAVKTESRRKKRGVATDKIFVYVILPIVAMLIIAITLNGTAYRVKFLPTMQQVMGAFGFSEAPLLNLTEGDVAVHFIDVGQGDSILITSDDCNVLIDAGEEDFADNVIRYIESRGISKLDYVIATHPHPDHIGGMYQVIDRFKVGAVIMPELSDEMIPFSSCYADFLKIVREKSIPAHYAVIGESLRIGPGTYLDFLSPIHDDYITLNDFSLVIKLRHGSNHILLMGDAERAAENDMLNAGTALQSSVIKIGHHGSSSSSTPAFLRSVSPMYAVISVGRDNAYGHPTPEVMSRLEAIGCTVLTTAEYGNIVFVSDGSKLGYYTERGDSKKNIYEDDKAA